MIDSKTKLKDLKPEVLAKVQKLLGVTADGIYGPQTKKAWEDFKTSNYLGDLEYIGPSSFALLSEEANIDKLSKNFTLAELIASPTAARLGINNSPNKTQIENLRALCKNVLQPLRDHYGKPLVVTSGLRVPRLNVAVGGVSNSSHTRGEAADFTIPGVDNRTVWRWITNNLVFDQNILEYYRGGNSGWIHLSYSRSRNRKSTFTIG